MITLLKIVLFTLAAAAVVAACDEHAHRRAGATSRGSTRMATIVRDVDGDTIKVRLRDGSVRNVRLIGIDTPETHRPGTPVECGGPQASSLMASLVPAGARARLTTDPTQDTVDRYGRLLAYVSVRGRSLQIAELRAGWATVYVYRDHPFKRVDSYRRAAVQAKDADLGVWKLCSGDFHSSS